jgi:hypothetical protein
MFSLMPIFARYNHPIVHHVRRTSTDWNSTTQEEHCCNGVQIKEVKAQFREEVLGLVHPT